jgi:hypothetical protein
MDRYSTSQPGGDCLRRLERRLRWYRGIALLGLASLLAAACAAFLPGVFPLGATSSRLRPSQGDSGKCDCKLHPSTEKHATGMSSGPRPHHDALRDLEISGEADAGPAANDRGTAGRSGPNRAGAVVEPDSPRDRDVQGDPDDSMR